ncbi:MAG: radical SAM protein with 4Fe4S-binding SPASM domain [Lentimonas sp.]|jgi:radical SAM protein with 4Fe4S-binding SPASM domain
MSKINDYSRILSSLTLPRIINLFGLKLDYLFHHFTKNGKSRFLPFSLSIEPTTACNLGCPECPSGLKQFTRPTGKIDLKNHQNWIKQVKKHVFYINYYFQGEPFLHPEFLTLIQQAKKERIYTATSTNAHFIDEKKAEEIVHSGLNRLIISIDGLTQETYEAYRKQGQLDKVIAGTQNMIDAKKKLKSKTPHLIFQFLVVAANEHEIPELMALGKKMKIDEVRLKTAQLYDFKHGNSLMPKQDEYNRYKLNAKGEYQIKNKMQNHCWRMWSGSVMTWDGKLVPCCFDKDALHTMGNLNEDDFKTVWKSENYRNFRKAVFTERSQIEICQNCTEGSKVWA